MTWNFFGHDSDIYSEITSRSENCRTLEQSATARRGSNIRQLRQVKPRPTSERYGRLKPRSFTIHHHSSSSSELCTDRHVLRTSQSLATVRPVTHPSTPETFDYAHVNHAILSSEAGVPTQGLLLEPWQVRVVIPASVERRLQLLDAIYTRY